MRELGQALGLLRLGLVGLLLMVGPEMGLKLGWSFKEMGWEV